MGDPLRCSPAELILLAQGGDADAFGALIEVLHTDLSCIARRTVYSNRIDADDILQESILHAMASVASLRHPTRTGFLSWFSGIARNRVLALRKNAVARQRPNRKTPYPWLRMEQLDPVDIAKKESGLRQSPPNGEECAVEEPVTELNPIWRMGWLLRELYEVPWNTLATVLQRPTDAAARQLHYRARERMDVL